jgi:YegS/Rv2252/BmrU family lipid kinase
MLNSWFIIANPISGNHNFSSKWKQIQLLLDNSNINYSFAFTLFSKHEIELVQNAIQKGFRNIISIGGDGTLHHVVNGVMKQRYVKTSNITIAVIPLGTGNDWIKTYSIPKNIEKAITINNHKKTILQDIGVIKTKNQIYSYFNNIAGIGYDGYTVKKLKKLKRFGSIAYLLSGLFSLLTYQKDRFKIIINNNEIETTSLMTVFGICKFSGGGMKFTGNVNTSDGLLDISIIKNITFFDFIYNIRKLYSGSIIHHKKVETYKNNSITVIPQNQETLIQADGELIGKGTITVTIVKEAINFVIL